MRRWKRDNRLIDNENLLQTQLSTDYLYVYKFNIIIYIPNRPDIFNLYVRYFNSI